MGKKSPKHSPMILSILQQYLNINVQALQAMSWTLHCTCVSLPSIEDKEAFLYGS